MNIGRVYNETYKDKDGKDVLNRVMDIRTLDMRKRFTISINKNKYDGKKVKVGMEDKPDFHIWYNFSNKGESLPSEIVGSIKKAVSDKGTQYLKGYIQDPGFANGTLWVAIFECDDDKKIAHNHTHNVSWTPPKSNRSQNNHYQQSAQPNYYENTTHIDDVPEYEIEDDEIPF